MDRIHRMDDCASTMDAARDLDDVPDGTVVISTRMSEGRGQHGHAWHAPEGGLYLSMVLHGAADPRYLTLAVGNAVADVLEVAGAEPRMKWVNDVLVDGKKIAGVLAEAESTGAEFDRIIVGVGINVNGSTADWPHPLNGQAVTLEDVLGAESCMEDLEGYVIDRLDYWLAKVRSGDHAAVVETWRSRDGLAGTRIGFDPDGDFCAKLLGTASGIDDEGRLLIDVDGSVQAHHTGSVILQD